MDHIPGFVRYNTRYVSPGPGYINCASRPPYKTNSEQYRVQKKILYPINVGRNIARDGALTHFILDADIDMYPSAGLNRKFLEMVAADKSILQMKLPKYSEYLKGFVLLTYFSSSFQNLPITRV